MKSKHLFLTGFLGIFILQFSLAQTKLTNLGLIAELAYVKQSAENHLSKFLDDTTVIDSQKRELISDYLELKTAYDQIILQLASDNNKKNHIKYFKKIDRALQCKTIDSLNEKKYKRKVRKYILALKKANGLFIDFKKNIPKSKPKNGDKSAKTDPKANALIAPEDALGALGFISSTIKDIREARSKKVESINLLLNDLRLSAIQELGKPKEEEEKKEK